jgi:starch synthase
VRRHLPECDVVIALSGRGLEPGLGAQSRGGRYVCDRGSAQRYGTPSVEEGLA